MNTITPKLTVVGAGPGAVDLITLKGIKAIESANVILYDALVNEELLDYASKDTECIFVGKRKGCYSYHQDQINELILVKAKEKGHVIRLKGGDPFVFGRGSEELDYARLHGLKTAVVPGLSSSFSVPECCGIPLTKRGVSESFWVITATTKEHKISQDLYMAAQSNATVVILMGMHKLNKIVSIFKKEGKNNTAVAIIQNGTRDNEKSGIGQISNIEQIVKDQQLAAPAIIVIGEVVKQRSKLSMIQRQIEKQLA